MTDTNEVGQLVQDWGSSNRYSWSTTPQATLGVYTIRVDARDASDPNVEQSVTTAYALGSAPGATNTCAHLALIADPTPPQPPGTTVVFRAQVTSCPLPLYRFWLTDGRRAAVLVQDWTDLASYLWLTAASTSPGDYLMRVEARNAGVNAYADVALIVPYTLSKP